MARWLPPRAPTAGFLSAVGLYPPPPHLLHQLTLDSVGETWSPFFGELCSWPAALFSRWRLLRGGRRCCTRSRATFPDENWEAAAFTSENWLSSTPPPPFPPTVNSDWYEELSVIPESWRHRAGLCLYSVPVSQQ
jgi:hypothetical protein